MMRRRSLLGNAVPTFMNCTVVTICVKALHHQPRNEPSFDRIKEMVMLIQRGIHTKEISLMYQIYRLLIKADEICPLK
jgi:hypothetical protein